MKPNPVTSFRDEDAAAPDAKGGAPGAAAPGGEVILSVPHVAHAAVLLQLLSGILARTPKGLLDPTHLHFLDRSSLLQLQQQARDLESQADRHRSERDRLREALEEARELHRRSAETAAAVSEDLRRSELERQQSEQQLTSTRDELARCQLERRFLRDDVLVKDTYLATLRQRALLRLPSQSDTRALTARLDDLTREYAGLVQRAAALTLSNREIHQELERARQEFDRVHISVAETLAQPRYVVADRCNAWARKATFLHAALKRVWTAWHRRR